MHRVGKWLDRGRAAATASTKSLDSLAEAQNLEAALKAVELIMDDDIDGAERGLAEGNSAFHKLAKGTLGFMKATLGFEQEVMKEASDQLYEAETLASTSYYKAQNDNKAFVSSIYDKGSEFALCQAESQVMSAVVGVLNESLTESLKGFYKLRKAYATLDSLVQMEINFMKIQGAASLQNSRPHSMESLRSTNSAKLYTLPLASTHAKQPSALRNAQIIDAPPDDAEDTDDSDEFFEVDAIEERNAVTEGYSGKLELRNPPPSFERRMDDLKLNDRATSSQPEDLNNFPPSSSLGLMTLDADSAIFSNSLDVFIHSGTNLMSGVLNLMLSMIPPAFGKLLYVIGFKGDRDRGIRMLWQASKFGNINGGMAGLVIFGWYNGLVGFCDIIPDSDPNDLYDTAGYPAARLEALLVDMRKRYPRSQLWLIEEARMAAARRDLDTALEILSRPGKSKLKQLEALQMFEKSLNCMYSHRYELCAESFLACVDLNGWSQSLYYYIAAASHLALYRHGDLTPKESEKHKKLAEEYFKTAPSKVGKKKFMGRQLPFDGFVLRKIAKWEARATAWQCSFIDAIGVSPLEEMIYLWGGHKRMQQSHLERSLQNLAWSESTPHWHEEEVDEQAILALLRSVILRNLRQHDEAIELLRVKIIDNDPHSLKGQNRDDWPAPTAHYEVGVNLWMQRSDYIRRHGTTLSGIPDPGNLPPLDLAGDVQLVQEAKQYVEKAKNWEKFELDARIGMKITAALSAIKGWEQQNITVK